MLSFPVVLSLSFFPLSLGLALHINRESSQIDQNNGLWRCCECVAKLHEKQCIRCEPVCLPVQFFEMHAAPAHKLCKLNGAYNTKRQYWYAMHRNIMSLEWIAPLFTFSFFLLCLYITPSVGSLASSLSPSEWPCSIFYCDPLHLYARAVVA